MFLLHRCLGGVDGFTDAAELKEKKRRLDLAIPHTSQTCHIVRHVVRVRISNL